MALEVISALRTDNMKKRQLNVAVHVCADSAGYLGIRLDDRCVVIDDSYTIYSLRGVRRDVATLDQPDQVELNS